MPRNRIQLRFDFTSQPLSSTLLLTPSQNNLFIPTDGHGVGWCLSVGALYLRQPTCARRRHPSRPDQPVRGAELVVRTDVPARQSVFVDTEGGSVSAYFRAFYVACFRSAWLMPGTEPAAQKHNRLLQRCGRQQPSAPASTLGVIGSSSILASQPVQGLSSDNANRAPLGLVRVSRLATPWALPTPIDVTAWPGVTSQPHGRVRAT